MAAPLHALAPGTVLDGYEILSFIGSGGFGITYVARDSALAKRVAIKEYMPSDLAVRQDVSVIPRSDKETPDFEWGLSRFLDEARVLARFDHPNVVRVFRFFEAHGTAYIVMDFVAGETLGDILTREGRLPERRLREIVEGLLRGLETVHGDGFLHRDIKPGNVILRPDGTPVLLDFGSARQSVTAKSRSVTAIVTPGYAPIEQYSSRGNQGPWTDIYAVGAICYRAMTGEVPVDATERVRRDPLVPASGHPVSKDAYSPALLAAVEEALRVDEDARPQSVAAWRAFLSGEQSPTEKLAYEVDFERLASRANTPAAQARIRETNPRATSLRVGETFRDPLSGGGDGPEMVVLPSGSFMMGSPLGEEGRWNDEGPRRSVRIGYQLAVGKYEVTWEQYSACVSAGGCPQAKNDGFGQGSRPVTNVSWEDAQSYVAWLNRKTGLTGRGDRYRLLSEAEWEYAARAGTTTPFYTGSTISTRQANYNGHYNYGSGAKGEYREKTVPVGSFPANAFGLYDMHGNVWEWVEDCYEAGYSVQPSDGSAFTKDSCPKRVSRGGSWLSSALFLRSATRGTASPGERGYRLGFRLARTLP